MGSWNTGIHEESTIIGVIPKYPGNSFNMRVWISRRIRIGTVSLILVYTALISVTGFSFCTLFYCRNCQKGSITKDELFSKLSSAARKLGFESADDKEEKESMPKPSDFFEKYGTKGFGRVHVYVRRIFNAIHAGLIQISV